MLFNDRRTLDYHGYDDFFFEWDIEGGIFSIRWGGGDPWVSSMYEEMGDTKTFSRYAIYSDNNTYIVESLF